MTSKGNDMGISPDDSILTLLDKVVDGSVGTSETQVIKILKDLPIDKNTEKVLVMSMLAAMNIKSSVTASVASGNIKIPKELMTGDTVNMTVMASIGHLMMMGSDNMYSSVGLAKKKKYQASIGGAEDIRSFVSFREATSTRSTILKKYKENLSTYDHKVILEIVKPKLPVLYSARRFPSINPFKYFPTELIKTLTIRPYLATFGTVFWITMIFTIILAAAVYLDVPKEVVEGSLSLIRVDDRIITPTSIASTIYSTLALTAYNYLDVVSVHAGAPVYLLSSGPAFTEMPKDLLDSAKAIAESRIVTLGSLSNAVRNEINIPDEEMINEVRTRLMDVATNAYEKATSGMKELKDWTEALFQEGALEAKDMETSTITANTEKETSAEIAIETEAADVRDDKVVAANEDVTVEAESSEDVVMKEEEDYNIIESSSRID